MRIVAWVIVCGFLYGAYVAAKAWGNPWSAASLSAPVVGGKGPSAEALHIPSCADKDKDCK